MALQGDGPLERRDVRQLRDRDRRAEHRLARRHRRPRRHPARVRQQGCRHDDLPDGSLHRVRRRCLQLRSERALAEHLADGLEPLESSQRREAERVRWRLAACGVVFAAGVLAACGGIRTHATSTPPITSPRRRSRTTVAAMADVRRRQRPHAGGDRDRPAPAVPPAVDVLRPPPPRAPAGRRLRACSTRRASTGGSTRSTRRPAR